jgi:HYR domain-containing protein
MLSFRKISFFIVSMRLLVAAVITAVLLLISFSAGAESEPNTMPANCPLNLLNNPGFELPVETPNATPLNWTTSQWSPVSNFSRDHDVSHSGSSSIRIITSSMNDAWFSQNVNVEPNTPYLLTGWIKTQGVDYGAGANFCLAGTWTHTEGVFGTRDWTFVRLLFNSGSATQINIGARLGYWGSLSAGTAWFDDLRLTPRQPDGSYPRWKILVLIYDKTDAVLTDAAGVRHHMVGAMTPADIDRATVQATQFVQTDIPALDSGNMIPELTIRYPNHPLTQLDTRGDSSWWPSPANTAPERDPAFDSVMVIWEPRVIDEYNGTSYRINGGFAGLTPGMGTGQTYLAIIIDATGYGHRNVFKHEWGHSILSYFDAIGTAPKPTVTNHAEVNQYVHWPTGDPYVWIDETDATPIPNSIYNNESGFTHDYYSGNTATADEPARRLGITPNAWMLGGPVTGPGVSSPPPVMTCNADISVANDPSACSAPVTIASPEVHDVCGGDLKPIGTRSDGLPLDAPYSCGETVITWTATNADNITSSCQQVVTVKDEQAPTFVSMFPPVTVTTEANATSCGVVVDDAALRVGPGVIAIDNCSGLSVTRSGVPANNLFPIGETIITYTATDPSGNSTSVRQTVTVIDNTPPVIAHVATDPAVLWPPNHQMVDVTVNYDVVECAIAETWLSVDSNDPDAASDWEVVDTHHVRLRAKRSPRAGDRVYTITISVKDSQGNLASQNAIVRVPKHK